MRGFGVRQRPPQPYTSRFSQGRGTSRWFQPPSTSPPLQGRTTNTSDIVCVPLLSHRAGHTGLSPASHLFWKASLRLLPGKAQLQPGLQRGDIKQQTLPTRNQKKTFSGAGIEVCTVSPCPFNSFRKQGGRGKKSLAQKSCSESEKPHRTRSGRVFIALVSYK